MPVFEFEFQVNAGIEDVRAFHRDTTALKKLSPPLTYVQIHEVEPLANGSVSRFTLWVGPIPLKWKAIHRDVSELGFTDVQAEGPAQKWEHTHSFIPLDESTTELREHVVYEHFPGIKGLITRFLFAKPNLFVMFAYRRYVTKRSLER